MTDLSFQSADSSSSPSNIGNVRQALAALHAKVAMLEKDRDAHAQQAAHARNEHEDYKARMEAELNRERMIAAEKERQLLEDVAAAEAEIHHLKERLRASSLNPLPQRGLHTDADLEFEDRANQQLASEKQRIEDAEHEISKLEAERQVLESANMQLDQTIQHLLRSNEDLLQMLRITPRSNSPAANPAAARGAVENNNNNNARVRPRPSSASGIPLSGGNRNTFGSSNNTSRTSSPLQQPPLHYKNALASPNNNNNNNTSSMNKLNSTSTLYQKETISSMQRNRKNGAGATADTIGNTSARKNYNNNASSSSMVQYRDPGNVSTFERLAQPQRSCSRNRAVSPPHCTHGRIANGTAKNTARRFFTQELRSHATEAVPH